VIPGTEGYAEQAAELVEQYESVPFVEKHQAVLHLLPTRPCHVLDIGAGTGADASWFAGEGHSVVAVEPTGEFRQAGMALHPSPLIEWVDVQYKVRSASTVIEMPRVASAGRSSQSNAMRDLIRSTPPKPVLTAKAAVAKAPAEQAKPQLPAWLSRISQRFVE